MTEQLPCKNCITLAMCKSTADSASHPPHCIALLQLKCSLLKHYIRDTKIFGIAFWPNVNQTNVYKQKQIKDLFYEDHI